MGAPLARVCRYGPYSFSLPDFWILTQVSRSVTVRLKTGRPGRESRMSAQKYPNRSNCQRLPGAAPARAG